MQYVPGKALRGRTSAVSSIANYLLILRCSYYAYSALEAVSRYFRILRHTFSACTTRVCSAHVPLPLQNAKASNY